MKRFGRFGKEHEMDTLGKKWQDDLLYTEPSNFDRNTDHVDLHLQQVTN